MKKKLRIAVSMVLCFGLLAGCGGTAEEVSQEAVQEEAVQEEAAVSKDAPLDKEQSEAVRAWVDELYGGEYAVDWYEDITDIQILNQEDGKRSMIIESKSTDESVASSMAMVIWGFDDTIDFVSVISPDGDLLYHANK